MSNKYFIPILILIFTFSSCGGEPEFDDELLVGTVKKLDKNQPFPFLLEKTEKGFYLIDHRNQVIDSSSGTQLNYEPMDTMRMENHEFIVFKSMPNLWLTDIRDSVNYPYQHPMYAAQLVRTVKSKVIDLPDFLEDLQAKTYQTEVESAHFASPNRDLKVLKEMRFSKDSLETFFTYFYDDEPVYSEREVSKYQLFKRKGKVFFTKDHKTDKAETLYQVLEADSDSFTLRTLRNNEEVLERFKATNDPQKPKNLRDFTRCMEGQPGEYYHKDLTYLDGNEFLIQKIGENAPTGTGDGYITIHFTLNCNGQMGNPGLEQMNLEYKSTSFEAPLVQHLIDEVMKLEAWPKVEPGWFYEDIHSFLMFKITNGKITDLCP
ncbi:hypothetical protein [Salegentibacter sp. Hel_I_6]|uniref:hypothetical protein n=1 Tax=Salegentibacter sp. Hel_I_6 TaxID=1250278 RepID=UPI000563DF33|nr:hypothetical protein [Salegentibacter sp. Hel_I_6]